jgi:hypothetical protein
LATFKAKNNMRGIGDFVVDMIGALPGGILTLALLIFVIYKNRSDFKNWSALPFKDKFIYIHMIFIILVLLVVVLGETIFP